MRPGSAFATLSFLAFLPLMGGCSAHRVDLDPRPAADAASSYTVQPDRIQKLKAGWYESLNVAALSGLIGQALDRNFAVQQARARLEQAEALSVQDRSERLPQVDLRASSSKEWEDGNRQEGFSTAGLSMSWEIDAFNRLGAQAMSSRFSERAAVSDIEAIQLSLSAEIAESWFGAVAQQQKLNLLQEQKKTDEKLLDLIQKRLDAGVGTNVEVLQQKSQLAENESLLPPAQAALRTYENRLDVLTGAAPDGLDRTSSQDDFAAVGMLPPLGVPSDLLLNRPDLRAMKDRLIAADADIAQAVSDRLPHITLTGAYLRADGPVGAVSPSLSLLGQLVQPLLDWGQRKAEVRRNEALYKEDLAAFTQAYLEAVEDVENALYQEDSQREYIHRLEAQKNILEQTLSAAEAVYREGESDYLPVLQAVQNLRRVERDLVDQHLALILYRIKLFRALGAPLSGSER